jgi:type IV secretory pathway TraG/TraD family ATPase VirD4
MPRLPVVHLAHLVETGTWFVIGGVVGGVALALLIRRRQWSWTWAVPLCVAAPFASLLSWGSEVCANAFALAAIGGGLSGHLLDLRAGGDLAQRARDRISPATPIRRWFDWHELRDGGWVTASGTAVGFARRGDLLRLPTAGSRPVMGTVVGATGSGKSVTMTLHALAAIRREMGIVYIDPKGDDFVQERLRAAAQREGRRCLVWSPGGGTVYNPYDRGTNTEIADKLLAAEVFTEPHYQRLAQRYIGHVVRALRLAGEPVSLATVVEYMHNGRLASLTRKMSPTDARPLLAYLETLTAQQERDLAGARDRLAILAESDIGPWLEPTADAVEIDLQESLERGDVVIFQLEADRRPLAAEMLGAAIIQDLIAITAERQHGRHRHGLIVIDEFSALGVPRVASLFSRARNAKLSLLLGTQELSDLKSAGLIAVRGGDGILNQVTTSMC